MALMIKDRKPNVDRRDNYEFTIWKKNKCYYLLAFESDHTDDRLQALASEGGVVGPPGELDPQVIWVIDAKAQSY